MYESGRLIHLISSRTWGAPEQYALDVCRAAMNEDINTTILTGGASGIDIPFNYASLKVRHLPLGKYTGISTILGLCSIIRKGKVAPAIHVHAFQDLFPALAARRLSRRPDTRIIYSCHTLEPAKNSAINRRILRNLYALIFPSALSQTTFLSTWNPLELPLRQERIHTLEPGIYLPTEPPVLPGSGPTVIGYYGRLEPGSGLETLIQALPSLRNLRSRALIAGPGHPDYIDSLKRLATRLNVMNMIDWRAGSTDRDYVLARSHIGICPPLLPQATSMSAPAFMATSRSLVASTAMAQAINLQDDKNAILFPGGDVEALTHALTTMLTNEPLRTHLAQNALAQYNQTMQHTQHFDTLCRIYFGS